MSARSEAVTEWDLVVVGAGPAGASTALAALHADPSLRVLLLDRSDFPRDKSCGDGIAPHCFERLASIGVTGVETGWTPLTRLELARGEQSVEGTMARPVHVIPREVFDARLVERAVARGAELRRDKVVSVRMVSNGTGQDKTIVNETFSARVVVGAHGAHTVVRSMLGHPHGRRALAIRG
jgi:flavin-dependent dehydrogenase